MFDTTHVRLSHFLGETGIGFYASNVGLKFATNNAAVTMFDAQAGLSHFWGKKGTV
jgi:hypothetical protein